jgi:hypothetical protein
MTRSSEVAKYLIKTFPSGSVKMFSQENFLDILEDFYLMKPTKQFLCHLEEEHIWNGSDFQTLHFVDKPFYNYSVNLHLSPDENI